MAKRINDLSDYTSILPYASEMFGIYQPLLGWKSKQIQERIEQGRKHDRASLIEQLQIRFRGIVTLQANSDNQLKIEISPGVLKGGTLRNYDSILLQRLSTELPPYDLYKPEIWPNLINRDKIESVLKGDVATTYASAFPELFKGDGPGLEIYNPSRNPLIRRLRLAAFQKQVERESSIAGALLFLVETNQPGTLEQIFYSTTDQTEAVLNMARMLNASSGVEAYLDISTLDPTDQEELARVAISPISVVHLFRQYFFELDTFLGSPESHVWLSPGSSVELLEIHTRRITVERTLESALEILTKTEKSVTEQEEISAAVKEDNQRDVKFGASVSASYGSITATSSLDYGNSQKMAREATHKRMREQTEKLSSEIRKNYKSTFKTISEVTDVSSIKHVMANTTNDLINYELRRKMRQVGVQVQDIGTFLCWQTYVDDPGKELGLGKLIHLAQSPDLSSLPHPEEIPLLQTFQEERMVTIPFISIDDTGADNEGEVYEDGVEVDDSEWFGNLEKIQADFRQEFVCPKANYDLADVEFDPQGKPVRVSRRGAISNSGTKASLLLHLDSADFQGQNSLEIKLILHWSPQAAANDIIAQKNRDNAATFKEQEKAAYERAFVETAKERVTIASKIAQRRGDDLREEERIVVYRQLIQQLLLHNVPMPDDKTRHLVAELVNSIFDVEKMLYFVAPEWWRPRLHRSKQQLQESTPPPIVLDPVFSRGAGGVLQRGVLKNVMNAGINAGGSGGALASSTVGWGGTDDPNRDNYYITEDSEPARMGSSLGWLLQLDGDNLRNAFLNAPWVKAVIPIRPGKEEAAINWLKSVEGMNGITDEDIYHASNPNEKDINGNPLEGQKMIDVLFDLGKKVQKKYQEGIETGTYPKQDEVTDPDLVNEETTVTATPIDRVYEHGFFPLQGSFRLDVTKNYEIFDQWIEILPTDQIVPVPVKYDPRTGRQIEE